MGEDISLIERYLDVCKEQVNLTEALGIENNVVRFVIPAKIDFSLTQEDINQAYPIVEFKLDLDSKMPYIQIKRKLIDIIERLAKEKIDDLNKNSDGFHITNTIAPSVESAKWFRTSPSQILNYYKKQLQEEGNI